MENEIKIINDIIAMAVVHGADAGGSYESNGKRLTESIEQWLELKQISDKYEVDYVELIIGRGIWDMLQIVEKK